MVSGGLGGTLGWGVMQLAREPPLTRQMVPPMAGSGCPRGTYKCVLWQAWRGDGVGLMGFASALPVMKKLVPLVAVGGRSWGVWECRGSAR